MLCTEARRAGLLHESGHSRHSRGLLDDSTGERLPVKHRAISDRVLQMTVREKSLSMMRDTRNGFVALVALMVQYPAANETGQAAGTRVDPLLQLRASIPEISKCRQLIVVTTEDWNAISATIQLFERTQGGQTSWQKVGKPFSGVIGSRGFAWGIGLHGTGEQERREKGKETKPLQPGFSGYSQSSVWLSRLKFASSGFLTNRSPRQRKQSMILSPGTTIALLTGRQLHAPTGRVRNRCCALGGLTGAA
jgi:hypothetical protein